MSVSLSKLQENFLTGILLDIEPQNLGAHSRFNVYERAYRIRLQDSLEEDFPETLKEVQDPDLLLRSYIEKHPSAFWTVGEFGKYFPLFIRNKFPGHENLSLKAHLEWARWVATSIGDPMIPPAVTPGEEIKIIVNPSLQIVSVSQKFFFVYSFNHELREEEVTHDDIQIIAKSLLETSVSNLDIAEEKLISLVSRWSAAGVIIGFKELT